MGLRAKWLLFPGLDLHTRCRYRFLPRFFRAGPLETLDAGCGNGALAYALGNRVLAISYNPDEIARARALFTELHIPPARLEFTTQDLYDLPRLGRTFDQIICSETLEHLADDALIVAHLYDALRPGGVLHLCCPNAQHPLHCLGRTRALEDGGHVRDGYTLESYRRLLEPAGFTITRTAGLGSAGLTRLDQSVRYLRNRCGDLVAVPWFLAIWPFQWLDALDPPIPFSWYVQAVKPVSPTR